MASAPKFNTPRTSPPASGWAPGHRPPAGGYGQLEGTAEADYADDGVSAAERDWSQPSNPNER